MPTPPTIDIDALLAPIAGDDPAGGPIPFALRERLDQARKEINPDDFEADDPQRPAEAKHAEWATIIELASEALAETSKDLTLVARLIEAATRLHGFAGLRDGFRLTRRLVDEAWDRLRPAIEEPDDLEVRAAAINWLDDADRGARFPSTIRTARLVDSPLGSASWLEWNQSRNNTTVAEVFEKVVAAAPRAGCQQIAEDLDEVVAELTLLLGLSTEKMGQAGPGLVQIRQAVAECRTLAYQVLGRKGAAPAEEEEVSSEGEVSSGSDGSGGSGRGPVTRAQVFQRLVELADTLERIEPQSPIPFVIRRAIALGQLSFPELMKELISDSSVLADMSRNLGIKELQE